MNIYYYSLILIFLVTASIMIYDENVVSYIDMLFKSINQKIFLLKWWLFNNPKNPIVSYFLWRKNVKLARELQKELFEQVNNNREE